MSKTHTSKAKGRRLQQYVANKIKEVFCLSDKDVVSRPMGSQGTDIMMSEKAHNTFPFDIECKNQESLNLWKAWEQAHTNTQEGSETLLVIKKNRTTPLAVLDFDTFIRFWNDYKVNK